MRKKGRNFINSLSRGLGILEVFTHDQFSLTFTEIVKEMKLSQTTVFRIIHTLKEVGYLKFDSENRRYYLGPKVLKLGFATLANIGISDVARPYMEELNRVIKENINLGILDDHEIVYIDQIKSNQILDINLHVGSRISIYNSAIGRAIMMYMPKSEQNEIIKKLKQDRKARLFLGLNGQKFLRTVEEARERGFAINNEEYIIGVRAIAVPILNHQGSVKGGINISVPSARVSLNDLESKYAPFLIETGQKISAASGFSIK